MGVQELYNNIGGDYHAIKARIGNDAIILKFLKKFPNEPSYDALMKATDCEDIEAAFVAAHTLKGVVANLSFQKLYEELSQLSEQLRPRTENADKEILARVTMRYEEVIAQIALLA